NQSLRAVVPVDSTKHDPLQPAEDEGGRIPETIIDIPEDADDDGELILEPATMGEQTKALIQRRVRFGLRDKKMFMCQLLLPLILLAGALALVKQGASER
ncbi:hypothetical protein Pmar_PMAR022361, partial [Perkinsus marinus ATCC 50983]